MIHADGLYWQLPLLMSVVAIIINIIIIIIIFLN